MRALQHDPMNPLDQFDEPARRAVAFAQEEARLLAHSYLGTEHLLLGLLDAPDNTATRSLLDAGVTRAVARQAVIEVVGKGRRTPVGFVLLTPRARGVLETAARYRASQMPPERIGPMDLLAGIVEDPTSVALKVLHALGVDTARLRVIVEQSPGAAEIWHPAPAKPLIRASCPQCRAVLANALTTTTISDGDAMTLVTYCGSCGWTLSATPVGH